MSGEPWILKLRNKRAVCLHATFAPDIPHSYPQAPNLSAARAFAFAASSSRFLGGAFVSSEWRRRVATSATSSTAARNEASFALEGLLKPLIFLTNCSAAARVSSGVTGGSKLKRVLIFLHICCDLKLLER